MQPLHSQHTSSTLDSLSHGVINFCAGNNTHSIGRAIMHNRNRRNVQRKRTMIKREINREYEKQYRAQLQTETTTETQAK